LSRRLVAQPFQTILIAAKYAKLKYQPVFVLNLADNVPFCPR
jgi:hypothetical protein